MGRTTASILILVAAGLAVGIVGRMIASRAATRRQDAADIFRWEQEGGRAA